MASRCDSQRWVLASMSVNKNVTVPVGKGAGDPDFPRASLVVDITRCVRPEASGAPPYGTTMIWPPVIYKLGLVGPGAFGKLGTGMVAAFVRSTVSVKPTVPKPCAPSWCCGTPLVSVVM